MAGGGGTSAVLALPHLQRPGAVERLPAHRPGGEVQAAQNAQGERAEVRALLQQVIAEIDAGEAALPLHVAQEATA
jgi:hypothetical protein